MTWLWILIGIGVLFLLVLWSFFNKFAVLQNRIENSSAQIDVQLKKRADLVPNLVEIVKGYMKHEKNIMIAIVASRKALFAGRNIQEKVRAGDVMSRALRSIFALAENYPQLKASENFKALQEELTAIEDKIAYARQFYNDSVLDYDNLRSTFPGSFFGNLFKKPEQPYLKILEAERAVLKIKFD